MSDSQPTTSSSKKDIKQHFHLTDMGDAKLPIYLLLCIGQAVTVRSQQRRALDLAWALQDELKAGKSVAVIGGGAAGMTFAAAAVKLGAIVHLFEASTLMHLQIGCHHRPLHPEIYTWPKATAFRPVSHLPLLGWTTGNAHDVATELVSKFRDIERQVNDSSGLVRLLVKERQRATLTLDGKLLVTGKPYSHDISMVVLAVGFGLEAGSDDLPLNSYWRVDAMDQSLLGDGPSTIVASGAGDGALVDLLRACVQEPEHGALWDKVLAITLQYPELLADVGAIDQKAKGSIVGENYRNLEDTHREAVDLIDTLLKQRIRPSIKVHWLVEADHPFDSQSQVFWRFIASRLLALAEAERKERGGSSFLETTFSAKQITVSPIKGGRYLVEYFQGHTRNVIVCQQVLLRWGLKKDQVKATDPKQADAPVLASVARAFEAPSAIRDILIAFLKTAKEHKECNQPSGWEGDSGNDFRTILAAGGQAPPPPELKAEFVAGFNAPEPKYPNAPMVYRIRIWLAGLPGRLWVQYDLHPEEKNKPITRVGIGDDYEQWLNTRNDYTIRVRSSDGFEWNVKGILAALQKQYSPDRFDTTIPILTNATSDTLEKKETETIQIAIETLDRQTNEMT